MMLEQIGYKELTKYIFNDNTIGIIIDDNYFESISSITEQGYNQIVNYLKQNTNIKDFNLLLGILSTLAYGNPSEEMKNSIREMIIDNKNFILSNIDSLEAKIGKTLNLEESINIQAIIDMKISFELLKTLNHNWTEYHLHKKYIYGINYLLVYFSKYCLDDFDKWFLSTKSKKLKIIFTSQILSSYNSYQENELYFNSKIDFLSTISKITFFTHKNNFFDEQKEITDLKPDNESLYFIMLYINNYYYKIDNKNINDFNKDIVKLKPYIQFLSLKTFDEFVKYINLEILYMLISIINDSKLKNNLLIKVIEVLKQKISLFDKSYIADEEVTYASLYGKILLELNNENEIKNIKITFDKIFNEINEAYYFYRFNNKWEVSLKQLVYYLIILYNFYHDDKENHILIIEYKTKIKTVLKEYSFLNLTEIQSILKKISMQNANKNEETNNLLY